MILKGYWLAQLLFYKIYETWDAQGIILLRGFLLILVLAFTFLTIRKQGASFPLSIVLIVCVFTTIKQFGGERPQLFTFLAFSVMYYFLEDFRINRSKKVWLVPLVVMVLANMHPGYIVCILLISLYVAAEATASFNKKSRGEKQIRGLLLLWALTIVCSMVNPLGPVMLTRIFSFSGEHTSGIVEFMPTFKLYFDRTVLVDYAYISFLFLSVLSIWYWKKLKFIHLVVLTVFAVMSFTAIRFLIFFMCTAAPVIARTFACLKNERIFYKATLHSRRLDWVFTICIFIVGVVLVFSSLPSLANQQFSEETRFSVPKGASDFLQEVEIKGNMFNEYGFGGHLIWKLFPEKKVFMDGRVLDARVLYEYNAIASATSYNGETWEDKINRYDITHVVMPALRPNGEIYPLVERIFDLENWALIYHDHLALIFLRKEKENADILKKYNLDKKDGLNTIIVQASARAMLNPANPRYYLSLGKAFLGLGQLAEAEEALLLADQRDHKNSEIIDLLRIVQEKRERQLTN